MGKIIQNKRVLFFYFVLCSVVWSVFGNSLQNDFVWDDKLYTSDNPVYKNFAVIRIFTTLANGLEYLPVRDLSYALDHAVGNGKPLVFHISNLLIYTAIVCLVFAYARAAYRLIYPPSHEQRDARADVAGFITAILFAVHPIHSEVVNFITCRNALLSTMFFFASILICTGLLSGNKTEKKLLAGYVAVFALFVLSLFSKATSIILPLILVLHLLYANKAIRMRALVWTAPFFVAAVATFLLMTSIAARATIIANNIEDWTYNGIITKTAKALQITVFYLGKLLIPHDYSVAYDTYFAWSLAERSVIIISCAMACVLIIVVLLRKKMPYLGFGIAWYLITLIPVLNFFATKPVVADRYAFLPSFAFFFVLACILVKLTEKIKPLLLAAIVIVLSGYLGTLSVQRNRVWLSEETLWSATMQTSPKSQISYRNLGNFYLTKGDREKALYYFYTIVDSDPCYYYTLAVDAYQKMDYVTAKEHLIKSLGRDVMFIGSLYYLGMVYEQMGDRQLAAEMYRQALRSRQVDGGQFKVHAAERLRLFERSR